jgi:hypothetical protein
MESAASPPECTCLSSKETAVSKTVTSPAPRAAAHTITAGGTKPPTSQSRAQDKRQKTNGKMRTVDAAAPLAWPPNSPPTCRPPWSSSTTACPPQPVSPWPSRRTTPLPRVDGIAYPVCDTAGYAPFGFGYRRCAGEQLTTEFVKDFLRMVWAHGIDFAGLNRAHAELLPVSPRTVIEDDICFRHSGIPSGR